jgi:alanine racemase
MMPGDEAIARLRHVVPAVPREASSTLARRASQPSGTPLALVPLSFADGAMRSAGQRGSVSINGVRCPIAGRIAMDQFVVDAGDSDVHAGDDAILFGPGDHGEPTAADWAQWAQTHPHEVLIGVSSRVARRYLPAPF